MFSGALALNQDLSRWDVCGVLNMSKMFQNAVSFYQDLSMWNIYNDQTNVTEMFSGTSLLESKLTEMFNVSSYFVINI